MKDYILSLIIPCYNVEDFIVDCVNSVILNIPPSLMPKVEIIIVNDGSTDNTLNILREITQAYTNIFIINKSNSGLSAARNDALDIAHGKYISFLDSDDVWLDKITDVLIQLEFIESDIIEFNSVRFNSYNDINKNKPIYRYLKKRKNLTHKKYKQVVFQNSQWMVWSRIYHKRTIGSLRFPEGVNYEDILFTSECYEKADNIFTMDVVGVGYRYVESSITSNPTIKELQSMRWLLTYCEGKFRELNDVNSYLLLANTYLCYSNIVFHVGSNFEDNYGVFIRNILLNDERYSLLPLMKKFKIKNYKTFTFMKKLIRNGH